MDPVLVVLQETQLQRYHIDNVCELLDVVEAKDVYTAFEILCKLQKYLAETQSWSFKLLGSHDFETPGNKFELNLATMVGERCQKLLDQMVRWDVGALQRKVRSLPRYSDWSMVLTSLVLRIGAVSHTVEFNLRLALSRATLVRIHCELSLEIADIDSSSPLVHKYRSFVKELLGELEDASSIEESEKVFKTVSDIKHMFRSYKSARMDGNAPTQDRPTQPTPSPTASESSVSSAPSSTGSLSTEQGILSSTVLGAFEKARKEQQLTALISHPKAEPPTQPPLQTRLDAQTAFKNGPFKIYHPQSKVIPQQQPTTSNIATTSLMRAMRTGKWT